MTEITTSSEPARTAAVTAKDAYPFRSSDSAKAPYTYG